MKKKKTSKPVAKRPPARPTRGRKEAPPPAKKKAAAGRRRATAPVATAPAADAAVESAALAPSAEEVIVLETPEPRFASRVLPPEPDRPFPVSRHAIFFDVENASRPEHIARVIEHLGVDRSGRRTDFVAVGNWRVIGHDTARLLARHGAHLIHSAPSVGVRDWSDLRIAVGAGVWLAGARPGDVLEIVTSDRAFDAVGDVAASLGIDFRRLSHGAIVGQAETRPPVREAPTESRSSRYRGRGRRRGSWRDRPTSSSSSHPAPAPSTPAPAPRREAVEEVAETVAPEPAEDANELAAVVETHAPSQTAPHDEIIAVVHDLLRRSTGRSLTLDTLANALKSRGFSRPPGSPRLITRLRRIKEIALSRNGVITLVGGGPGAAPSAQDQAPEPEAAERMDAETPVTDVQDVEAQDIDSPSGEVRAHDPDEFVDIEAPPGNRRMPEPEAVEDADVEIEEGPGPGNELVPSKPAAAPAKFDPRRRRSRRGGRGRGPRPQPTARAV